MCKKKCLIKKIKTDFFQKSTFFESPITQKRSLFEYNYVSCDKRQKSCTFIVILIILSYLTSPIFNSLSKSTGYFICRGGSTTIVKLKEGVLVVQSSHERRFPEQKNHDFIFAFKGRTHEIIINTKTTLKGSWPFHPPHSLLSSQGAIF